MRKVSDISEISKLVMAQMKPGVFSNNFIQPDEYRQEIASGTLYAFDWDGGLLLLRQRKGLHLLTFYINDHNALPVVDLPDDTVLEITQKSPDDTSASAAVSYWTSFGFTSAFDRIRLTRPARREPLHSSISHEVRVASPDDLDRIYTLLYESFDTLTGCLPLKSELLDDIIRGYVLCVVSDGEMCGVLRASERKGVAEIRHLAVRHDLRGRGIARDLLSGFVEKFGEQKCIVWMRDGYAPAFSLYANAGFTADGWRSTVMLIDC